MVTNRFLGFKKVTKQTLGEEKKNTNYGEEKRPKVRKEAKSC